MERMKPVELPIGDTGHDKLVWPCQVCETEKAECQRNVWTREERKFRINQMKDNSRQSFGLPLQELWSRGSSSFDNLGDGFVVPLRILSRFHTKGIEFLCDGITAVTLFP